MTTQEKIIQFISVILFLNIVLFPIFAIIEVWIPSFPLTKVLLTNLFIFSLFIFLLWMFKGGTITIEDKK